jgi:hypothetical protein
MTRLFALGLMAISCFTPACRWVRIALEVTSTPDQPPLSAEPTQAPCFTKDLEQVDLEGAQGRLDQLDPQGAIDLLQGRIAELSSPECAAMANQILGDAQMMLRRSRLAGAYYARAFDAEPSAQRLFLMATANDLGGDLEIALGQYVRLEDWAGPDADPYRMTARDRIVHIISIIGTPTALP